uniref:Uncharacterized protein n=1 Tax=Meloidogyne enterolobii TaxID=390850 RepID=A0A6V7VS96_MELEN|nr:unnamed protein product [Meloidogyne enterolobii]CAD2199565.1 unnamed protein product [Meloidogyne enterolobii]
MLLIVILINSLSYANGDNTLQIERSLTSNSVIDTAANAIATASSATSDMLLSLKNVGLNSSIFLKALVPIGSMVVKEFNPEPNSLVYRELMQFKQKTENIWNGAL